MRGGCCRRHGAGKRSRFSSPVRRGSEQRLDGDKAVAKSSKGTST